MISHYYPLLLMPLGVLFVFYWYSLSYHDFFAYFKTGDNIHLQYPPFLVFNKGAYWVGDIWLEDIIYIFLMGFLAGMYLMKQKLYPLGFFVFTFMVAAIMVVHRDV